MKKFLCIVLALIMGLMCCGGAYADDWSASFILAMVTDTATELNPLKAKNRDVISIDMLVYESLIELDDTGKPATSLATRLRTAQDGGWTWDLTIREGITFHNGASLTAADAAASREHVCARTAAARGRR